MEKELYKDSVYAYALYKTLAEVDPPLTVGLYASCHSRIKMILASIEGHMNEEANRNKSRSSIGNLISLILRLLFYRPVWTEKMARTKFKRYVFVRFSAWHFAGSDMLWAGLVMQLCQALQDAFGKLQLSLFKVAQYDKEIDAKPKKMENTYAIWRAKKICCCPLWASVLTTLMVCLFVVVPVFILSVPKHKSQGEDQDETEYGVVGGFLVAVLGVPAVGAARFLFALIKSLAFSQDAKVKNALDNQKISEQLGLMHEVRKEMRILSCFVHFMEHFQRQKIKVVLEITNLERCTPAKIVGVLDAIGILLSDDESPFVSLVAVDPEVLTQKIDQAKDCYSEKDRAYGFLDRIITLPFTAPPLCEVSKRKVFEEISSPCSDPREDRAESLRSIKASGSSEDALLIETRLVEGDRSPSCLFNENIADRLIQEALRSIYLSGANGQKTYISESTVSMRRVANSIRVSMMVVNALHVDVPSPDRLAAWVVLVDRWPCRLSWILQCIEDEEQTSGGTTNSGGSRTLWEVFGEHRIELYVIRAEVETFLERDDDPELFQTFLSQDFVFTVKEAKELKDYTVNLDYSIKNELARIRQIRTLREIGKSSLNSLSPNVVINMSVEDVCDELCRLKLPDRYGEIIKRNEINGQTLLLSDPADLRQVMRMTLGEWTTFRIRFLGVVSWEWSGKTKPVPVIPSPNATCLDVRCCTNHRGRQYRTLSLS